MDTKTKTLKYLTGVFRDLITSLRTNDEFDYGDSSAVDRSTNWDSLPECSALTVFSLNGLNAPSIRNLDPTGVVVTFPADIGGDIQMYLTHSILAVRKVGSPAGWAYLGLNSDEKIFMDDDTADVLRDLTDSLHIHNYVTTDSNQNIDGQKDFSKMPLYKGDRLIGHTEFGRLTSYVRNNFHTFHKLHEDIIDNSNDTELLSNDYHDIMDTLSNYVKQSDLNNYAPLSQLDYYATKKDLTKYATNDDFQHMQEQLQNISDNAQHPVEDDLARIKDTMHRMNERIDSLNKINPAPKPATDTGDVAKQVQWLQKVLSQIDLGKVKATIHKIDLRASQLDSSVSAENSSLSSLSTVSSNHTSDINKLFSSASSLSNAVLSHPAGNPVHPNDDTISNMEKSIGSNSSAINSLSAEHSIPDNQASLNSLSNSMSTFKNDEHIDVQSLANQIKALANDSATSKINSVVTSAQSVQNSQSATNTSLSNALSNNASQTSSVENDLISALSKHQL